MVFFLPLKRYNELEMSLHQADDRNQQLQEQIHQSQRHDTNTQDILESRELENASLKKALKDLEQKAKVWTFGG